MTNNRPDETRQRRLVRLGSDPSVTAVEAALGEKP
jgi:hypothetical protein